MMLAVPSSAPAAQTDTVACNSAIAKGIESIQRGRYGTVNRCIAKGNFGTCTQTDNHTRRHENSLIARVSSSRSRCVSALTGGSTVADFGPPSCPAEWNDCDVAYPSIDTLEDLAGCVVCGQLGQDIRYRSVLALPASRPQGKTARKCLRSAAAGVTKAVRTGSRMVRACMKNGEKPFACPVDDSASAPFGRALATLQRNVLKHCGGGDPLATLPAEAASSCGGAGTAGGIADCMEELSRCLACRSGNTATGSSEDCIAFSGDADCTGI